MQKEDVKPKESDAQPLILESYFSSKDDIAAIIKRKMWQHTGKIWACSYQFTSSQLAEEWATRIHINSFNRACAAYNIDQKSFKHICDTNPEALDNALHNMGKHTTNDRLIIDKSSTIFELRKLINAGVAVYVKKRNRNPHANYENMHHKFMIFYDGNNPSGSLLINGSFNLTNNATHSWENIIITNESNLIEKFVKEFNDILPYCDKLT